MAISIYCTVRVVNGNVADEHVEGDDDYDDDEEEEEDDVDRYNDCCPFPFVVTTAMTNEYVALNNVYVPVVA